MEEIFNFLEEIGCFDAIDSFKEQEIDLETVYLLKENELKELFPKIGPRLKFKKYIDQQQSIKEFPITSIDPVELKSISEESCSSLHEPPKRLTKSIETDSREPINSNIDIQTVSKEKTVCIEKRPESDSLDAESTSSQLNTQGNNTASLDGRAILREGQIGGGLLKEASRRKLSQLLILNELEQNPAKTINTEEFHRLATDICQLFSKESVLVYFSAYVAATSTGIGKKNASGKLYETYISRRRKLRENGSLPSTGRCSSRSSSKSIISSSSSTVSNVSENAADEAVNEDLQEANLLWLRNNVDPWQIVEDKWRSTADIRLKNISKGTGLIEDYIKNYPALKQPQGYTLLLQDFSHLYPGKDDCLFANITLKKDNIIKYAHAKLSNTRSKLVKTTISDLLGLINDADSETSTNVALMLLAHVINISPARKKKNKPLWKPSRAEICDSFIAQTANEGDVPSFMIKTKENFLKLGQTVQPYVLYVGDSVVETKKVYVIVNDTVYSFQKLITAIDCAFKIYQALALCYPGASEDVWTTLQIGFYGIKTKFDRNTQAVNTLLTDLELI